MISLREINNHGYETTPEQDANLAVLVERVNLIRIAWGKPMTVTSGLRSHADQERINPSAPKSKHVLGAAVDIYDPELEITTWLKTNPDLLEQANLFCELGNENWVHFQCLPFGSYSPGGTRWFKP
jgi:hypothetical protein